MKAKNGKCGVFAALTAALLVTAVLITSCEGPSGGAQDGYQPPEGYGYLTVKLPEFTGERTILPSAGTWASYNLSIQQYTALNGGTMQGSAITRIGVTVLSDPINLAPGFYALTVTANTAVGAAAEGTSARFTISAGTGTSVTVTLKPLPYTAINNGTFEYSINFNSFPATAEMTITPLVGGAVHGGGTPFVVTEGGPTSIATLTPGSYSVFLEATLGTGTASITEIVNIHQNLKSSVTFDFNGSYFVAYIDGISITYTPEDTKPVLTKTSAPIAVTESTTISLSLASTATETITITNDTAFTSIRWYCGSSAPTTVSGNTFTIAAGTAPFTDLVTYPVTVVGITANGAYGTSFKVSIVN